MQSSSTFLGFLGSTAYFRFALLKLMVNLEHWKEKVSAFEFKTSDTITTVQGDARTLVAGSYSAGCGCLSEHGGWRLLSGPSWALEETSCVVHAASCSLGGNHGPTEGLKSAY